MNVCLVGYGTTAHSHARVLQAEGITVDSVVGRLPDQTAAFAAEIGASFSTIDLARALDRPHIDAVVICSPSAAHADQTAMALTAGKHVLCEIPLAMCFADADQLAEQAEHAGRVLMVAHTHRYYPAIRRAKERLRDGSLELHHVIARYVFLRRENVDLTGHRRSWTDNLLWHHGCHAIDTALWLLGVEQPDDVDVTSRIALPDQRMGTPLDLSIIVRTGRDQLASVDMSYNAHLSLYDYLLIGTKDTLLIADGVLRDRHGIAYDASHAAPDAPTPVQRQDRAFIQAVQQRRQPAISARSILPAMWVLQQAQDTADSMYPTGAQHPLI